MYNYLFHLSIYKYIYRFGLISLFNGISTFVGYLMPKATLWEEQ